MKIAILPGDGIGPEVTVQGVKALKAALGDRYPFTLHEAPIGGAGYEAAGDPLPPATLDLCRECDAILHGAAGVPEDEQREPTLAAGRGLLRLRKALGLFANFAQGRRFCTPNSSGEFNVKTPKSSKASTS